MEEHQGTHVHTNTHDPSAAFPSSSRCNILFLDRQGASDEQLSSAEKEGALLCCG